jgi:hypothetical protein
MANKVRSEKHPIGTKVLIIRDCRFFKRAVGKTGFICKVENYTIPNDIFPLEFKKNGQKYQVDINDLQEQEDLTLNIPTIKYGKLFGRIKGDRCFWVVINDD